MLNDKTSKDFELEDLEKPLTEQEMKETNGGDKMPPGLHELFTPPPVPTSQSGGAGHFQFQGPPTIPPKPAPIIVPVNPTPMAPPNFGLYFQAPTKVQEPIAVVPILPNPSNGSGTIPTLSPQEFRDKLGR